MANAAIDALNGLYGAGLQPCAHPSVGVGSQVSRVHDYIFKCSLKYVAGSPPSSAGDREQEHNDTGIGATTYDGCEHGAATSIIAESLSLPHDGGTFDACEYLGPELAGFLRADPETLVDPLVATLAAGTERSCQKAAADQYAATVARLMVSGMAELSAEPTGNPPLGLFAVPKRDSALQRLIVDARPSNFRFHDPPYEHTGGDDLTRIHVLPDHVLEAAKVDLADFFHTIRVPESARVHFGLRPLPAVSLKGLGVDVPAEAVDAQGNTHPRLTTCPMGWKPAPAVAQASNEAVLYGAQGTGSAKARELVPVVDLAARLSSRRVPEGQRPHALVIDDLLLFRQVPRGSEGRSGPDLSPDLATVLKRYREVDLQVKLSKVHDYSPTQILLGYLLEGNELCVQPVRYDEMAEAVRLLEVRRWAGPREVEKLTGQFTHAFLLHRPALSIFSAVYAFGRKLGHRRARLWPSVLREFRSALALLPLVRSDLSRPTSPVLIQTDASDHGGGVVYTTSVPTSSLQAESKRPRGSERADGWTVEKAHAPLFEASAAPEDYRVAVRERFGSRASRQHINAKELHMVVTAVRWAARAPRTRGCRLVLQTDSAVAVGIVRKGRSSKPGLLRHARRLAAFTLAERLELVPRWTPTSRNMADAPSRGSSRPGPCVVRPKGRGQGGYAATRVGESKAPGPGPPPFWSPLLDARISRQTRENRYRPAVLAFLSFVRDHGDDITDAAECDYWLAYYVHMMYTTQGASKSHCSMAVYGLEFWMPEVKPLRMARACLYGWGKLVPPKPYAPMPRDLAYACAIMCSLTGDVAVALAILLSFDCFLRISEVSGLRCRDVVDHRMQADEVGQGVAVYMPKAKTGRRQAVMIEDPELASLVAAWKVAVETREGADAHIFPRPEALRQTLKRAIAVFADDGWETRGLSFVWHSLRHGGASRMFLRGGGSVMPDILVRGRWSAESSGRHYVQSGRQLLLGLSLPAEVAFLARQLERLGLRALLAPDVAAQFAVALDDDYV